MESKPRLIWESNNEISVVVEQGAVHLKAVSHDGDPVELSADEATKLIEALVEACRLADSE